MVGLNASDMVKRQQLIWNIKSQTSTFLRMIYGAHPFTPEEWSEILCPVLIICGENVYTACAI